MNKPNILPAKENEIDSVLEILNEAAEWLDSMGLPSRWRLVNLSREKFLDQTRRGEVFVAKLGEETVGTITLQWSDPVFWRDALPDAGYVHKLAVSRVYGGRGLGLAMLEWAENMASARGKKFLRLDCLADNKRIREYYESAGFKHVGDVQPFDWKASLYEKKI